jgi:hypothetical protein
LLLSALGQARIALRYLSRARVHRLSATAYLPHYLRPGLPAFIDYVRSDESPCVVRLDRLEQPITELMATVESLRLGTST